MMSSFEKTLDRMIEVARELGQACRPSLDARGLMDYDAGLLNDFGGGDVNWWQDYLRAEIERANEFWREQIEQALAAAQKQGQLDVGSPRTPEQIAATVAWVQSLADSDIAPQPTQQDGGGCSHEAWEENGGWCKCVDCGHGWSARTAPQSVPTAQDGSEAYMEVTVHDGAWAGTYAEWCRRNRVAPPSAPAEVEAKHIEALRSVRNVGVLYVEEREAIDAVIAALAQQPAAVDGACAAVAAIQFALSNPEGMTFLRLWNEGEFDALRREWPEAPSEVYVGADPLATQHQEPTT